MWSARSRPAARWVQFVSVYSHQRESRTWLNKMIQILVRVGGNFVLPNLLLTSTYKDTGWKCCLFKRTNEPAKLVLDGSKHPILTSWQILLLRFMCSWRCSVQVMVIVSDIANVNSIRGLETFRSQQWWFQEVDVNSNFQFLSVCTEHAAALTIWRQSYFSRPASLLSMLMF